MIPLPTDMPADWPHRAASRIIACPPHRWHAQEIGPQDNAQPDAPLIVLIHGAGGATHSFRDLMPLLARTYRCIAIDLPGQGFTRSGARNRLGLDGMSEDLAKLCADQGWQPDAIIGHSAGAAIALRLAELLPTPPKAIIGLNAALGAFDGVAGWLFPMMAKALALTPFVPQIFARLSGTEARVRQLLTSTGSDAGAEMIGLYRTLVARPAHVEGTLSMMAQWQLDALLARLPGLRVPVLLIAADNDRAVPARVSADAARRLPKAEYREINGFGHLLHEVQPALAAAEIGEFLARTLAR